MSDVVIRVENLSKRYIIGHERQRGPRMLRDRISGAYQRIFSTNGANGTREEFWALKDVSFEVKRGEVIGVIGRNGAGKSTLLKILSRITEPTSGRATITGRVASLLEVGTGFHPELTGRENVYLNGAILGMSRTEIGAKFDEIVSFAEVEKFVDMPIKHYSSGMQMRLAFSVAAHLEPEILLVDEVLAVGDIEFQKKCLGKMDRISNEGRSILFVSHNMAAILALCSRLIWLEKGVLELDGSPKHVADQYISKSGSSSRISEGKRTGIGPVEITGVLVRSGNANGVVISGEPMQIELGFRCKQEGLAIIFTIGIYDALKQRIVYLDSSTDQHLPQYFPSQGTLALSFPENFSLFPDRYTLNVAASVHDQLSHLVQDALSFIVTNGNFFGSGKIPRATATVLCRVGWNLTVLQNVQ